MTTPDPADPFAQIREQAAQRLRSLADKQQQLAAGWLAMVNKHANLSTTMIADALESGTLKPELWLSNTTAMAIECISSGLDFWLASVPLAGGATFQQIVFVATTSAETVGPVALSGATPDQFADVDCSTPLAIIGPPGGPTIPVTKSIFESTVQIGVQNLIIAGNPYPAGVYTGKVMLNVAGTPKLLAVITLVRD